VLRLSSHSPFNVLIMWSVGAEGALRCFTI
jgi:hypothetical protein